MAKILEEEYDEKKPEQNQKLEYDEFQKILDNHIVDMDTRKQDKAAEE